MRLSSGATHEARRTHERADCTNGAATGLAGRAGAQEWARGRAGCARWGADLRGRALLRAVMQGRTEARLVWALAMRRVMELGEDARESKGRCVAWLDGWAASARVRRANRGEQSDLGDGE